MEKAPEMLVVYNMGNFHNGKTAITHNKEVAHSYELAGYKLISTAFMSMVEYLAKIAK